MGLRRAWVVLAWALAMALGGWLASQTRFTTDLSFFLPSQPSAEQQVLVEQLRDGVVSRLIMVAVEGGDSAARAERSRALRQRLAADADFVSVQNGELDAFDRELALLQRHRYTLSPAVGEQRFTPEGLRDAILNTIDIVSSPAGLPFKAQFAADPTGEAVEVLMGWQSQGQPALADGVWTSRDGERALLLLQTRAAGADTDGQARAAARVQAVFDELSASASASASAPGALRLELSGPGVFAVKTRAAIQADVARLTMASAIGISVLLWFVFRRWRPLLLTLVPAVSGSLAGLLAVGQVHGSVFAITAGFGAALVGEAVDYGIYYFVQTGRADSGSWRQRFWPTIRLGVATSMLGFGALLFAGFPGLAQLGLYAMTGVFVAALTTRLVLPAMAGHHVARTPELPAWVTPRVVALQAWRWPALGAAVLALAYLVSQYDRLWEPDLSALSSVSLQDAERDARLRGDLGAPDARHMVVVRAPDREAALRGAEAAARRLDPLVAQGLIGGYDSPARFLPSEALQRERQRSLPTPEALSRDLALALQGQPLSADRLQPFVEAVARARTAEPVRREDLGDSALAIAVDSLLQPHPDGWTALLPLRPAPGAADAGLPAEALRAALTGSGANFVDLKQEFESLYGDYLGQAIALSLLGLAGIVLVLGVSLRNPRRLVGVMLPIAAAVLIVIAVLHGLGVRLHLLHLIGTLLIVAVGSNYSLFIERWRRDPEADPQALLSVLVACATTAIGFGVLSLSSVPVLQAVGVTVAPGAVLALLLSAMLTPAEKRE
ncbi:MAG TPA: MMPL family transporter [Hydrogenophaga sp.]|uniref:MMPL family transporter n=1 Tax=Hydrogenophaga sp. TaxID=1904254 RepID=UPI002CC2AC1B|nr:MMPL family transporter [Hydrogenophaga sp.]HSX94550.1 MMPL family transporter [Hydrogenophaga sp.]